MAGEKNLTVKQKRFINYYVKTGNAKESAIKAGYSKRTAAQIGSENLTKLEHFIKKKMESKDSEVIASQDEVLIFLTSAMRGLLDEGEEVDVKERMKAAELLGKRYRLFTDNIKITNDTPQIIIDLGDIND